MSPQVGMKGGTIPRRKSNTPTISRSQLLHKLDSYSKFNEKTFCLEWQKSKTVGGYGQISVGNQKQKYAHRVAYELLVGDIPDGMYVCHSCDNPSCVNPEHLFLGTQKDNMQDCKAKGRMKHGDSVGSNNPRAKLTESDVMAIRASNLPMKELATHYGVSVVMISNILLRKNWRHIG